MRQSFLAVFVMTLLSISAAGAESLPRWEIGMGFAGLRIPDYRGSDRSRGYVLPLPYIQYRGDILRIDREGAHGEIFASDRIKLELSINAGPPAKSGKNDARRDMPDIDPTIEAGPSLHISLARNPARDRVWTLRLPWRAAVASNFSRVERIGWIFAPHLNFDARNVSGGWDIGAALGPLYATEDYHDYFYEVQPAFATAARPVYDAPGGYSGNRLTLTASKRFKTFWIGAFARYDNLAGAAFADSPLVKRKDSLMVGAGIAWVFAESKIRVPAP